MADEESKSKFMDILARGAEGAVDGLAESYPILGGAVQAMANTDEYQARQLQKQVATQKAKDYLAQSAYLNDQLQYEQEQRDEWRGRKGTRDAIDAAALKEAKASELKSEEYMSDEARAERKSGREASTEENNLRARIARSKQDLFDQQQFSERADGKRKALSDELSQSPYFMNMTFDEQKAYLNSPDVQNMLDAAVYLEDIQGITKGDKDAYGRLERALARQGWDLVDGKDGMMYLDMGNGARIAATPQNIARINEMVKASAFEELNARNQISMAACLGNPAQSSVSKYAKALMPYNNNSAARSLKQVQSVYQNASPEEQTWAFFNQAFQDYNNPKLPTAAKLDGLQKCLSGLQSVGYTLEGYDPKNPSLDSVVLKNGKDILSLQQFADLCKSRDVISAQLDDMVERSRVAAGRAAIVEAVKNVKSTGKAESTEEPPEDAMTKTLNGIKDDLAAQFKIDFRSLSDEQQEDVARAYYKVKLSLTDYLNDAEVDSISKLDDEVLKKLDAKWKQMMEEIGIKSGDPIYNNSPVQDEISKRAKEKAEREKQEAEKKRQEDHEKWEKEEKARNKRMIQEQARTSASQSEAYTLQRNSDYSNFLSGKKTTND